MITTLIDKYLRVLSSSDGVIIQTVRRKNLCYNVADAKRLRDELTRAIEWAERLEVMSCESKNTTKLKKCQLCDRTPVMMPCGDLVYFQCPNCRDFGESSDLNGAIESWNDVTEGWNRL